MSETYELVRFVDGSFELEVNVSPEEDTVWLTQQQMVLLFQTSRFNIVEHIRNIYAEKELDESSTCRIIRQVRIEGNRRISRSLPHYNLDMIISVGFRVKSKRGITFRRWALGILRQYMLRGFAVDPSRVLVSRENYLDLVNVVNRIDSTQTDLVGRVERLEQAEREILLIDGYVDRRSLDMLSRKRKGVSVLLYTSSKGNGITGKELSDFNAQYPSLEVHVTDEFHDRFLILDRRRMYHIGASVKDAGRRTFEISENNDVRYLDMILEKLGLHAWDTV